MCCYADKMATIRENDSYVIAVTMKANNEASDNVLITDECLSLLIKLSIMSDFKVSLCASR